MSQLVVMSGSAPEQTMSSREIAELTGKSHANVMRDIRNMLEQMGVDQNSFLSFDNSGAKGRKVEFYNLPRRECEILVTGYDVKRRAAVIDRWLELELDRRQPAYQLPQNYLEALECLVETEKAKQVAIVRAEKAEIQNERNRPKVDFAETFDRADGCFDMTSTAKMLGCGRNTFMKWLRDHHVLTLSNLPVQRYIDDGRMVTHSYSFKKAGGDDGIGRKAMFTAKGMKWIEKNFREKFNAA